MIPSSKLAVSSALFLLSACMAARAITLAAPPKLDQLAGAWIGPEEQLAYLRLELDKAGHGILVVQEDYNPSSFSYYKITKTDLSDNTISFVLVPFKGSDPTVTLSGQAYSTGEMALVRSGINNGFHWHYKVDLQREDYLLPRIRAVQKASARARIQAVR